ncbi:Cell differentiation [Perilla frutescens var. frutescens]|nr:Cell differentiation [Perilla frutescens var. frutescens]
MVAFPDMALFLWYSFGTIAILLQEVLCVYTMMSRSLLSVEQSTRACDVLALFQCVASHPSTKKLFTKANIPVYLCSFLSKNGEFRDFEHVRISTLGVIGALVKVPDTDVITSLLSSEIMPICLRAMENGTEMSRTVATFILHGLLQDPVGLQYICHLPVRLYAVLQSLGNVVASLSEKASARLLKQVVKCYLRFLDDRRSLMTLKSCFPKRLQDGTFEQCVREDQALRMGLQRLLDNVRGSSINRGGGIR